MKKAFWICAVLWIVGGLLTGPLGPWSNSDGLSTADIYRANAHEVFVTGFGSLTIVLGLLLLWRRYSSGLTEGLVKLRSSPSDEGSTKPPSAMAIDKRLIAVAVAAAGAFFIASGFQTALENWAGQRCYPGPCFHPEWIAVGVGLVGFAVYLWTLHKQSP